jgi:phosphoserine phosphatase RsbU/P
VGGDYCVILAEGRYGLMLADVMGHGIASALYSIYLSSLWRRYHHVLLNPVEFAEKMNNELAKIVKNDESFATEVCGLVDLDRRVFRLY